jgi:hypothetical protein
VKIGVAASAAVPAVADRLWLRAWEEASLRDPGEHRAIGKTWTSRTSPFEKLAEFRTCGPS